MFRKLAPSRPAITRLIFAMLLPLALTACKEPLFSSLDELQANEMVAVLQASQIDAGRTRDKEGLYAVTVRAAEVGVAVTLLRREGYPRQRYATLGEVFPDEGIVGTPFEERARFMYALNEELSHTISDIAGIRTARVQVMIPPVPRYAETIPPSSAAVAVHHEPGFDAQPAVPVIKSLIAHAVPNLNYDQVEVALFAASGTQIGDAPGAAGASGQMADSAKTSFSGAMVVPAALSLLGQSRAEVLLAAVALVVLLFGVGIFVHAIRSGSHR